MKSLCEQYGWAVEGEQRINVTKDDLKEIYFKQQYVFPLDKYVNLLTECYNKLEYMGYPDFEAKKVLTLLDHINCTDYQVKAWV